MVYPFKKITKIEIYHTFNGRPSSSRPFIPYRPGNAIFLSLLQSGGLSCNFVNFFVFFK
jgi:hypothetical protein